MADKEKVEKAIELIRKAAVEDEIVTAKDLYEEMKGYSLFEVAESMAEIVNLIYELRCVLEAE